MPKARLKGLRICSGACKLSPNFSGWRVQQGGRWEWIECPPLKSSSLLGLHVAFPQSQLSFILSELPQPFMPRGWGHLNQADKS